MPEKSFAESQINCNNSAGLAGVWREPHSPNDELRAAWTLVAHDGKLVRQQWMTEDEELEPAFPDGYIGDLSEGQFVMHFNRDSSGRVTCFDVATDMVRPMRFTKIEISTAPRSPWGPGNKER